MDLRNYGKAILYGVLAVFIIGLAGSLLFSLLLKFTSLQQSMVEWIMLFLSFIAMFIGGFVTGGKGKENGMLIGALTGITYSFIIFLFQFLGLDVLFSLKQTLYHVALLATAMIGGILGVNIMSPATRA